jgi:hypothetical protein
VNVFGCVFMDESHARHIISGVASSSAAGRRGREYALIN